MGQRAILAPMHELNESQKKAVEILDGPLLILAGAGAGKTKTIAERVLKLIKNGVSPHQILSITFTNKAAREMKERINDGINRSSLSLPISLYEKPFVSTFHALGVHIIKENAKLIGRKRHFTIYDKSDSKSAIRDAMKKLDYSPKEYDTGKIQSMISREKGNAVSLKEYIEQSSGDYIREVVANVWGEYERILKEDGALDFDDLLLKTLEILKDRKILSHYQSVWHYIHIDEYQDTNRVQYEISRLLAEQQKNICVVGDIDQNIYSWRGAKLRNILDFEIDYPQAKVILLEENYRSTKNILDVANLIIKKNKCRKEKNLFTKNPIGEKISLYSGLDESEEAYFIASKSDEMIKKGNPAEEIAVLYRANFQSRVIEEAFLSYGIKYQLIGTKFFERKEVKDILSYIRAAISRDSISDIKRIINIPPRGIGKVSLLKIFENKADSLPFKVKRSYIDFENLLKKIEEKIKIEKLSQVIKFIFDKSGMEEYLKNEGEEGEERIENVRELVTLATRYDNFPPEKAVENFLTDCALQSDQDELDGDKKGVKLMTVHASKGLEFDYVFIAGLEENLFPHKHLDEKEITNEEDEEERRLFYVALTRARKKIFLSYSQMRTVFGSKQVNLPSEFILDIPEKFLVAEEGYFGLLRNNLIKKIEF